MGDSPTWVIDEDDGWGDEDYADLTLASLDNADQSLEE
jgi:hypothetical protein